jgi:hypothetical protein
MSFKEQINNDAVLTFLNTGECAENIAYTPKNGAAKIIPALIIRNRLDPAGEDTGRVLLNQAEIMIANDAENGMISINKGGDKVSFPERVGDTDIDWSVIDILDQDEGMWKLLVQK